MLKNINYYLLSIFSFVLLPINLINAKNIITPEKTDIVDLATLFKKIINTILELAIPIIVLAIVYSGFLFVRAQGDPSKLKEAKDAFLYVLLGVAVIVAANGAYAIFLAAR